QKTNLSLTKSGPCLHTDPTRIHIIHTGLARNEIRSSSSPIHHHRPRDLHSDLIRHGFPCDILNIRCRGNHCFDFHKDLLQPRPLHQSATFYFGHYSHCLLLDDMKPLIVPILSEVE
ncbi:hypothetical protein IGI04_013260, partial [Brassica rapa subsp. trilocularis]